MTAVCTTILLSLLALLATTTSWKADGFVAQAAKSIRGSELAAAPTNVPSWESLDAELETIKSSDGEEMKPVLTLYRDTNGWCPFCERVWVAIRAKNLPYQETLVPLRGKPEWYKQMVPTGLVPAVLFHGDEENETTSRELVWESDAILEALDAKFPDTLPLMRKGDASFDEALALQDKLQAAGFKFAYGNRNGTLTDEEIQINRVNFEAVLDELDAALRSQAEASGTTKCFRLGTEFSGVDAIMIPTLERWRYQLPLTENLDLLQGRTHLKNWFDTMDSYDAYGLRVAGDEYSWTATASQFLRYFGGGEDKPKVAQGIARADAAAEQLAREFVCNTNVSKEAAVEAAAKLISNHEAVVADCVREEPLSQKHVLRASSHETADLLLRHVASVLLQLANEPATELPTIDGLEISELEEGALALQTVSKRLCVPRDMGAPSAALLRGILSSVAKNLQSKTADAVVA